MISNYDQYRIELLIENLILESKLEFSKGFLNMLSSMRGNKIASELLKVVSTKVDLKFIQNYIDISDEKDMVTFIPDRKALQIIDGEPIKWITNSDIGRKYFAPRKNDDGGYKNQHLFTALGYTPKGEDWWSPESGVEGQIKSETISTVSGKTVVWFVTDDGKDLIANKEGLIPKNVSYPKLWTTSRNPVKVGRLAKSILNVAGVHVTTSEIESFVNLYKSTFDVMNDAFSKFKLVSGKDIAYWYNYEQYESMESTLGNSCMAEVEPGYFDIYVYNPKVCSLLILFSENGGSVSPDGSFIGKTIRGRALVWKTKDEDIFMDRVYTNYDSDIDLFKQYAISHGWWHKIRQNSEHSFNATDGHSTKSPEYVVELENSDFDEYPYMDTFAYLNLDVGLLSNNRSKIKANYELDSTGGSRYEI